MEEKYWLAGVAAVSVLLLSLVAINGSQSTRSGFTLGDQKAAVIQLSGTISSNSPALGSQSISPETVRSLNEKAISQGASAIIYEWNSGGGAVVASKEIKREIESAELPTVCRFRDVAASGAYLASLGCDRIVADSASITGSIGVKSSYLEFSGLMKELGVQYVNITAGKYKDVGSRYRNASKQEKKILKEKTTIIHQEFISEVQEERNLTESQVQEVSTGEIFLGSEAKELGLVDSLGGRRTAVRAAENLTSIELKTFKVESKPEFNFLSLLNAESAISNFLGERVPLKAEWR